MKTMLVTGAAHGIGQTLARAADAAGYRVGVLDVDGDATFEVAATLTNAVPLVADVRDAQQIETALEELGDVNAVVNNAGILRTGPLIDHDPKDFRLVMDVNINAVFIVAQAAARRMRDGGGGVIVNMSSINGIHPSPDCGAYVAAKAGVMALTQQMSIEWGGYGIRVNSVAPGFIDDGMSAPFFENETVRTMRANGSTARSTWYRGGRCRRGDVPVFGCSSLRLGTDARRGRWGDQQCSEGFAARVKDLSNMSVLVTGGGSGIGAGTARYLVEQGSKVTICGRRAEKVAQVADELGSNCLAVTGDVTMAADRERVVDSAVAHGGGLDALVNNAGNMYRGALTELSEHELEDLFATNVIAGMLLSGLCVSELSARSGAIVFLSSIHNRRAFPGASPYAASKGAIEALTRSLAAELGPEGITVNCVAPGAVYTEINQRAGLFTDEEALARLQDMAHLHALGRIGEPHEVAEAIAYFICAEWTTGTILDVDGGLALGIT